MKVIVANPGLGTHVRHTVRAYNDANILYKFLTAFNIPNAKFFNKLSEKYKGLKSKQLIEIPNNRIQKLQIPELLRLLSAKFFNNNITDKVWEWSELYFDKWVANQLDHSVDIYHGYEHASCFSLQKCKALAIFSVYEQPSVHHQYFNKYIISELIRNEDFFKENFSNLFNSELSIKRNKRRDLELLLSDLVLCNSTYVKNSLINSGVKTDKIIVLPLGFPNVKPRVINTNKTLRFMISGNLSYLKGVHHVLRVWKKNQDVFKEHELICIGNNSLANEEWENLPSNVIRKDRLNSIDYLKELDNTDVYILNSYSDGFGMVMSEAMAYGKAVIGTMNSAAPDIIVDGETGKLINIASESELLESMLWMIENPKLLVEMRTRAMEYAKVNTWENYREKLPVLIQERFNQFRNG